jgi:hypothetical protein
MIDLSNVVSCLREADALVQNLHGRELDETDAITSQSRGTERKRRAQMSQDLQLLATRLELAASLVRVEYWHARGETDPLRPERRD